jgi:hypothetical protein
MGKLVNSMIAATRQYLEASWWWSGKPVEVATAVVTEAGARAPAAAMANPAGSFGAAGFGGANFGTAATATPGTVSPTAGATTTPAATAAAIALERDYRYRLARKNVHVAFANLGQAFRRMMLEPKAAQKFVPELNDLLVRSHVLASQITAAAPLLRTSAQQQENVSLQPLQRVLSVVRDTLTEAEAGTAASADQTELTKQISRELDAMVVEAEKSADYSADAVHELKLLAHQCTQMLAAANQIRKDASVIRLPDE